MKLVKSNIKAKARAEKVSPGGCHKMKGGARFTF